MICILKTSILVELYTSTNGRQPTRPKYRDKLMDFKIQYSYIQCNPSQNPSSFFYFKSHINSHRKAKQFLKIWRTHNKLFKDSHKAILVKTVLRFELKYFLLQSIWLCYCLGLDGTTNQNFFIIFSLGFQIIKESGF